MKIIAIEKGLKAVNWENLSQTLIDEAKSVYKLMLSDYLREIYFSEMKNAVLILECENKIAAKQLLDTLPLVKEKIIGFELMELHPYTGFSRFMDLD
jgi:hypothetical protein